MLIIIDAENKTPLKIIVITLSLYTVISPRPARLVNSGRIWGPSVPSVSPRIADRGRRNTSYQDPVDYIGDVA